MALKDYQETVQLGRLYEVLYRPRGTEQIQPNLSVDTGTVDVHGVNSGTQPTSMADLTLNTENQNVGGIVPFAVVPRYILVTQNTGTTTELVISGLDIIDHGAI